MNLLLLAALQITKPEKPLDPNDARSAVEHAIYNTRSQASYETTFKSTLKLAGSDAIDQRGRCVRAAPGLLSLQYTASGNKEMNVIRAGSSVWVFDRSGGLNQWATALESGNDGAGRGLENPDEVLEILSRHADKAKFVKGVLEIAITGKDLATILRRQDFDTANSAATVSLETDKVMRLKKLVLNATLTPKDPANPRGTCTAEVVVSSFNETSPLKAVDANGKEIPLTPAMREAVDALGPKK